MNRGYKQAWAAKRDLLVWAGGWLCRLRGTDSGRARHPRLLLRLIKIAMNATSSENLGHSLGIEPKPL